MYHRMKFSRLDVDKSKTEQLIRATEDTFDKKPQANYGYVNALMHFSTRAVFKKWVVLQAMLNITRMDQLKAILQPIL